MTIGNDESLDDYKERFQLSYKRARCTLDLESLKLVLLRGVRKDLLDTLHLLVGGYIYQLPYEDIKTVFRNHSRATRKKGRGSQPMVSTSSSNSSIKGEIGNMLEDFKSEMPQTLALQMDTMHIKRKQEETERALAIFCPRCTRRHPRNECPLNSIEICLLCEENHSTDKCPSLPGLKVAYEGPEGVTEQLYDINQRRPHGPRPYQQGMQGSSHAYYNPNQTTTIPSWGPPTHISWSTPPFGPLHLSITPNQPASHFNHMLYHNLNGMHRPRGGGPNTKMLQPYCFHHLSNHSFYTLLHPSNPRCLPSQIQTRTTDKLNKYTMERHRIQLMLWKSRRLT